MSVCHHVQTKLRCFALLRRQQYGVGERCRLPLYHPHRRMQPMWPRRFRKMFRLPVRSLEDFVTWVDQSKIRRHIVKYNDKLDDYDLLGN